MAKMTPDQLVYRIVGMRPYGNGKAVDLIWTHKAGLVLTYNVGPRPLGGGEPTLIPLNEIADQIDVAATTTDDEITALIEARRVPLLEDLIRNGVGE